ncbi:MAG: beta strand repeat-containing protein, partial [Verrucomicrobiales bacterium]
MSRAHLLEALEERVLLSVSPIPIDTPDSTDSSVVGESTEEVALLQDGAQLFPSLSDEIDSIFGSSNDSQPDLFDGLSSLEILGDSESGDEDSTIVVNSGETLVGNGSAEGPVLNKGIVSPGNSPGVQNFPTFTQAETGLTLIEIGGTGGPGVNPNGHDQINVTGLATLGGTLEITLINGFVPAVGNSFTVMTWGSRSGEFSNWLGTVSIPGQPDRAFKPVYNANSLTLEVIQTPLIIPGAQSAMDAGLNTLGQIGDLIESAGDFANDLPLIGSSLGELIDVGGGIQQAIQAQLTSLLASMPRQSDVTRAIAAWDGTTVAGFTIEVNGVLGHYGNIGSDPFWWDIDLNLKPAAVNRALENLTDSALGAVFSTVQNVQVETNLNLDFSFGYDSGFFVAIHDVTASAEVHASGIAGLGFTFPGHGGASVTNASVDLVAAVTAVPDAGVLIGGRINGTTLSQIASGTIPVADAFNLSESGSLQAEFTLASNLTGFGFGFSGTTTVKVDAAELFNDSAPKFAVEVDGTLTLLNQVIQGKFTFRETATETILEAENVVIELKAGAGGSAQRLLRAENGSGKFVLLGNDLAGTASLTFAAGPAIPNLTFAGTTLTLTVNTSSGSIATIDGETVNLPAGPYLRVEGHGILSVASPSVALEGDFLYEPFDPTPGSPNSGDEIVAAYVTNLFFELAGATESFLSVVGAEAGLIFTPNGVVASGSGLINIDIGGVQLSSDASFKLNDTNAAYNSTVTINGSPLVISAPAGPYLRLEAIDTSLSILGVGMSGDFAFEKKQTNVGAEQVLTVAASNLEFSLGDTVNDLLTINGGTGAFILDENGLAGEATVSVALGVGGLTLSGAFKVQINNKVTAVSETVVVGGSPISVNVPAGPYLKITGTGVTLSIGGLSLTGDFSFEERTTAGGDQVIRVEAHNVNFNLGTNLLTATNGEALFIITNAGMAGAGQIDIGLNVFGNAWSHTFDWSFNNMASAVDEDLNPVDALGGANPGSLSALSLPLPSNLNLPAGPFNRLDTGGPVTFSINIGGQPQSITAEMVLTVVPGATPYITAGVSGLTLTLGAPPVGLVVSGGTGAFYITENGIAGKVEVTSATLNGATGVSITAENLKVEFNNTGGNVGTASTPITISVSEDEADDVALQFIGAYYHNFLAISGSAELNLAGFIALGGDFRFEKSGANQLKVAVEGLHFDLKAGVHTVASFHNGEGVFIINGNGIAGKATLDFDVGIIGASGAISLEVNTTSSPINAAVTTPGGIQNINLTGVQYLRVYVNGHLLLGPAALPYNFYVQLNTGTGAVEVRQTVGDALLVSVDATGAITTGLTIPDFSRPSPFEFVSMLRQLISWFAGLRESSVFNVEIPFTNGTTLGDAFDWSKLFVDKIYSFMVSIELQSRSLSPISNHTGPLNDARAMLRLGNESPVEIVVKDTIGNPNVRSMAELVTLFNNALIAAGLTGRAEARINQRNSDDPNDDIFVIALTPEEIAKGTTLNLVDLNTQFQNLGFGPSDGTYGNAGDVTPEQVGVLVERYDTPGFIVALGNELGLTINYDPAQRIYTYSVDETATYNVDLPFDFGAEFGDIAEANLSGLLRLAVEIGFKFTLGFDLGAREVPRILSSSLIPAPSTGRISADAHFLIYLNESTGIPLILTQASTTTNSNVDDLAADLNALFATATYNGLPLNRFVIAQRAGSGIAISALNEDSNGNGTLDAGEDKNGNGTLENQLGIINRLVVRSAINDTFATELGFGTEVFDIDGSGATTNDRFFQSASNSTIKGLFIEDVEIHGELSITTPTPISGSLKFGFVEITTSGGVVGTVGYDGTTPAPITATISLEDQTTGSDRFYLADLFTGLSSTSIGNMIEGPTFTGSVLAKLDNISVGGLGFSMPLGSNPEFFLWVPDSNVLTYIADPYNGGHKGIFLTHPH